MFTMFSMVLKWRVALVQALHATIKDCLACAMAYIHSTDIILGKLHEAWGTAGEMGLHVLKLYVQSAA